MKNRILLAMLMVIGSIQTLKTESCNDDNYCYDNNHVEYDYDADNIAICRSILDYNIEQLKNFIVPGNEKAVIKLLAPNANFDQYYEDYFNSCTFIHLLTDLLHEGIITILKESFNQEEINTYSSKILDLIRHAATVGIHVDATNTWGETALSSAVEYGAFDAVILLIQLGADVNKAYQDGITPLFLAVQNSLDQYEYHCYFASESEVSKSFVLISNVETVKALLAAGAKTSMIFDGTNYDLSEFLDMAISGINYELNSWNANQSLVILKDELLTIKAVL